MPPLEFFALNAALALILALLVGAICCFVQAPWFANRAWLLVLLKLVTPPMVFVPLWWWTTERRPEMPPVEPRPAMSAEEIEELLARIKDAATEPAPEVASAPVDVTPFPWQSWLVGGLLTGSVSWWSIIFVRIQRFRLSLHRLGGVVEAPQDVQALGREVADSLKLKSIPRLEMIDADLSPMLWVLGRTPRVLLPRRLWLALDADQRRAVLAHEFAHFRRKDHWVRRLELIVLGLYWWLPVAWLARQQLRRAEEACCDRLVVESLPESASKYAEALVETAAYVSQPRLVPLASGGAATVRQLKRRLQMIFQPRFLSRSQKVAVAAALLVGLLALPFGFVAGQEKTPPKIEVEEPVKVKPNKPNKPVVNTLRSTSGSSSSSSSTPEDPTEKKNKLDQYKGDGSVPAGVIQSLKDEVELLQVQMGSKEVAASAAARNFKIAQEIYDTVQESHKKGVTSRGELLQASKEFSKAQTDLETSQAALAEHKVRLTQAVRKLESVASPKQTLPPKPNGPKPDNAKPPVTGGMPPPADVEKLEAARAKMLQELELSAKAIADLSSMAQKMNDEVKLLQAQLAKTQDQIAQIQAKQQALTQERMARQKEAELIATKLNRLLQNARDSEKEKKPENPAK